MIGCWSYVVHNISSFVNFQNPSLLSSMEFETNLTKKRIKLGRNLVNFQPPNFRQVYVSFLACSEKSGLQFGGGP